MSTKAPALLVMAAGMGSRYGGLKQMDRLCDTGEVMLDFSVYDALLAGFEKIVIVIKREIEEAFEEVAGKRLRLHCDLRYAYQSFEDLPGGRKPPERLKPWGTGQAVWAARDVLDCPFAVINADDYYGRGSFVTIHDFLVSRVKPDRYAMVGFELGNTLTDHGTVARGVCEVENGLLTGLTERTRIKRDGDSAAFTEDGETWTRLPLDTPVSMQLFGFHPSLLDFAGEGFETFLQVFGQDPKKEFLLPELVGKLVAENKTAVEVLHSPDKWFGVTYAEDKPMVVAELAALREKGVYPAPLWK